MKNSTYHSILRIASLTFALILLFDSGLLSPVTRQLSENTQNYLGQAIGMYASVQPTELNQLTAGLTERQRVLTQRESEINEREIAVQLQENQTSNNGYSTYILSIILFVILVLIVINYVLDFIRNRDLVIQKTNEKVA